MSSTRVKHWRHPILFSQTTRLIDSRLLIYLRLEYTLRNQSKLTGQTRPDRWFRASWFVLLISDPIGRIATYRFLVCLSDRNRSTQSPSPPRLATSIDRAQVKKRGIGLSGGAAPGQSPCGGLLATKN
jgi:hypothetical protein